MAKPKETETMSAKRLRRALVIASGTVLVVLLAGAAFLAVSLLSYPDAKAGRPEPGFSFRRATRAEKAANPLSGVNLGVRLEGLNGAGPGITPNQADFAAMLDGGFRYIRVPVRFLEYLESGAGVYELEASMLERLDAVLAGILSRGMVAILDFHYLLPEDLYAFPSRLERERNEAEFLAVWDIVARRYRDYPPNLYFELANEPRRPVGPADWNRYVRKALEGIRGSGGGNRERAVVIANDILVDPLFHSWENVRGIGSLELPGPDRDPNILVTFHYYDPVPFTYQGQAYNRDLKRYSRFWDGNLWADTERQRDLVRRDLDLVADWAEKHGRKVILGEFGASVYADGPSQLRWTELLRSEAEKRGMIWIFWQFFYDYGGDTLGGLYSRSGGFWRSEMLDALQTNPRDDAAAAIAEKPEDPEIAALDDPEWTVRSEAADNLSERTALSRGTILALARVLARDPEWQVRLRAARALLSHPAEPGALDSIVDALDDPEWQVRRVAAEAAGRMGPAGAGAMAALAGSLDDPEWQVREAVLLSMACIEPRSPATIGALKDSLLDPEEHIRATAAAMLKHPESRASPP